MAPAILNDHFIKPEAVTTPSTSIENSNDHDNHSDLDHQETHSITQGSEDGLANDVSIIPYEDEYEKLNSTMQVTWSNVMELNSGVYTGSTRYQHVHVLMLSWERQFDDLNVQGEVDALRTVFRDTYNFNVVHKQLIRKEKRRTQTQINRIVADWVDDNDGLKTLLIVYFAGHGRPGTKEGDLEITGHRSPSDLRDTLDKVVWNKTEHNLSGIAADVFQIFDCCYAGNFGARGGGGSGANEYLAATDKDDTTPKPGPNSFTSALIWALKALAKEPSRFTTSLLAEKITAAPGFPEDQKPILANRRDVRPSELIVLQPLSESPQPEPLSTNETTPREISARDVVTIKFVFETRPDVEDIRKIGEDLSVVVLRNGLHVNRIMWGGIHPQDMVIRAVHRFRRGRGKSTGKSTGKPVKIDALQSQSLATKAAASFVRKFHEEVEDHVHKQVHEECQREFEAHSAAGRAEMRDT